jgi:hypothetical protein
VQPLQKPRLPDERSVSSGSEATADLYAVLGVPSSASAEEIRVAYRALAHRYHPDHNPGDVEAERRMQEINRAFAVLNAPERRAAYDERRAAAAPAQPVDPRKGAGRGQRPYYRGKNWGLHTGADTPPEHIVRAEPSSFNLVVDARHQPPVRSVLIHNDAPFAVRIAAVPSPWLRVSAAELEIPAGGEATLVVGASPEAAARQRGWRDGGVSLLTDDPRVFSPDVRVTAIFMGVDASPSSPAAGNGRAPDLREAEGNVRDDRPGWRRKLGL